MLSINLDTTKTIVLQSANAWILMLRSIHVYIYSYAQCLELSFAMCVFQVCNLIGDWGIKLYGYNTMKPYPNMSDHCPNIAPNFPRVPNC